MANTQTPKADSRMVGQILLSLVPVVFSLITPWFAQGELPLTLSRPQPSLAFETYLIDTSHYDSESRPVLSEEFHFTNQGTSPVQFTNVSASCGCLKPEVSATTVPPGKTGRILLPVRTANEPAGIREYVITVNYTDPDPQELSLTWKVRLPEKKLQVEPRVLMVLGTVDSSEDHILQIADYRVEKAQQLKITKVESSSSLFTARFAGVAEADGAVRHSIAVQFAPNLPEGQHRGIATVFTTDPDYPIVQIPVIAGSDRRAPGTTVRVTPDYARIIVNAGKPESSHGTAVRFEFPSAWNISHAEVYPPQLKAEVGSPQTVDSSTASVTVNLKVNGIPDGPMQQGSLTVFAAEGDKQHCMTQPISIGWSSPSAQ